MSCFVVLCESIINALTFWCAGNILVSKGDAVHVDNRHVTYNVAADLELPRLTDDSRRNDSQLAPPSVL